ncbi:MAG: MFS transporter [Candidatus Omnitrophota bacterium]
MARFREVLAEKNFFCLWLGQIISNFGDRLNQMALIGFVSQRMPLSTYELAKLMLFSVIPVFVIGPIAGAYVDRLNRRHIMIIADVARGFLVLLIPFAITHTRSNIPIYIIVFLTFSLARFFVPSKMAIIPTLVPREKLLAANSLSDTTFMIAGVLGIGVAGIVVKLVGVLGGFYIDSASFFMSATLISFIRPKGDVAATYRQDLKLVGKAFSGSIQKPVWVQVKEGLQFIVSYPKARFVMNTLFLLMAGAGAIFCVIIVFIQEQFGTITTDLGLLGMFLGAGLFCGALLYGRFGQRLEKPTVILSSLVLSGIGVTLFATLIPRFPRYSVAGAIAVFIGAVISPVIVSLNTLVHETIPDEMRGRIFSSQEIVIHIAFLLFMFLTSILAEHIARQWILVGCGVVFASMGLTGLGLRYAKRRAFCGGTSGS